MSDEMQDIIREFLAEAEESLDRIDPLFVELEARGHDREILNDIFRSMHTIKGAAGFLGFAQVVEVAHGAESVLKRLRDGETSLTKPLMDVILKSVDVLRLLLGGIKEGGAPAEDTTSVLRAMESFYAEPTVGPADHALDGAGGPEDRPVTVRQGDVEACVHRAGAEADSVADNLSEPERGRCESEQREHLQTLRVDVEKIDKVMNLTGEVVLIRNRLLNILSTLQKNHGEEPAVQNLFETVAFLDHVTTDMQLAVMKIRMQPIRKVFSKFPRLVRDISSSHGKDVELKIKGEDTEVDKSIIERIGDPMVHIIRNAIDHGLETPWHRRAVGKPDKGVICIEAFQKGNHIVIEVSDDGRGIDVERVKQKALEQVLAGPEEIARMSDETAMNLIFMPGFTTAEVATELSGRGVGMDVVRTNIAKLNGCVEVTSSPGAGTALRISIPLTLAITETLMVRAGGWQYAVPLAPIEGTLKISRNEIKEVMGQKVTVIRDRLCPVHDLKEVLGGNGGSRPEPGYAIVVSLGDTQFCLAVDELLGREEVVIKNVQGLDSASPHVLGATVTGDGKVVLILDMASLSRGLCGSLKT